MHLGTVIDCITASGVVLQRYTMSDLCPGLRRRLGAHLGTVVDYIMAFCAVLQRYTMFDLFPGSLGRPAPHLGIVNECARALVGFPGEGTLRMTCSPGHVGTGRGRGAVHMRRGMDKHWTPKRFLLD